MVGGCGVRKAWGRRRSWQACGSCHAHPSSHPYAALPPSLLLLPLLDATPHCCRHTHLHKVHAALVCCCRKPRHVADHAAAQRQKRASAVQPALEGLVPHLKV